MNIKLNKKQLIEILKAGYAPELRPKFKGCYAEQNILLNNDGLVLLRVYILVSHGKKRVYIVTTNPLTFNQYAAIKKIEEILNWK